MTIATATYAGKTNGNPLVRIGASLRSMLVSFVQANESHAALSSADYGNKRENADQLHRMARQFEASQPNLAAELRFIASRG